MGLFITGAGKRQFPGLGFGIDLLALLLQLVYGDDLGPLLGGRVKLLRLFELDDLCPDIFRQLLFALQDKINEFFLEELVDLNPSFGCMGELADNAANAVTVLGAELISQVIFLNLFQ